jgi:ABC-2 type transport system ATP-binding protein
MIEARNLHVTFRSRKGAVEALRGLDLNVPRGSLFVLLGPNGAGKTTLMRCVTGLVGPTAGSISVLGGTPAREHLGRLGVLIENPGQYNRLDAREYLSFFGDFYAVPGLQARIRGLCGELGLALDGKPVGKLSQGNRQKLQLARSLLHKPELLLWDEPTDHLDPDSQREVLGYLRGYLSASGATALVATHRLEQMESVATHFGFLAHGRLAGAGPRARVLDGTFGWPSDGKGGGAGGVTGGPGAEAHEESARFGFARPLRADELSGLASALGLRGSAVEGTAAFDFSGPGLRARLPEVIKTLVARDLPLASVEPHRESLADIYSRMVGP